ncbi:ATP-binding protein [Modestobacter versicolor]|uniref:ATP-binding protein n=1 Tax=Modestobacter versicolor TaxID=429133 RepID=A0A323VAK5_9ACTN|nr:ATP-binding protein [Modestobacter versicolor]MBB3675139.1 two-component sensor histidine kinase [Modestobacter versicolor]PZA21797.1 ATP-binding protein [Modestobacter versicolor]
MSTTQNSGRWPHEAPPAGQDRWSWRPQLLSELPLIRRELRRSLVADTSDAAAEQEEELHERLVLLMDELLSNALRHGRAPVAGLVRRTASSWLLVVSDAAATVPPHPDPDRDPARGGLGLRMVADLTTAYGWCSDGGRKHVWAVLAPA